MMPQPMYIALMILIGIIIIAKLLDIYRRILIIISEHKNKELLELNRQNVLEQIRIKQRENEEIAKRARMN